MSPLASLKHQAEEDLSVPTGCQRGQALIVNICSICQRGRALIVDMKRAEPRHSHISQAYPGLNLDFLPILAEVVLNRQERQPSRWIR